MATITLPSTPTFKEMRPAYRRTSVLGMSPFNNTQQVYVWPGQLKIVEFRLPPLSQTEADDWTQFLDSLNGFENTFNVDLSNAYPHESGVTAVAMRLMDPNQKWSVNEALHYGITFTAMEAK